MVLGAAKAVWQKLGSLNRTPRARWKTHKKINEHFLRAAARCFR